MCFAYYFCLHFSDAGTNRVRFFCFLSAVTLEQIFLTYVINHMMLYHTMYSNNSYSAHLVHENYYYLSGII